MAALEVDLVSVLWFLVGALTGLVLFEVAATLFYCLPKTAARLFGGTSSQGLLWLYLRALAHRCVILTVLLFCFARWGALHDTALAWGFSLVASFYTVDFFAMGGKARLREVFLSHAAQFSHERDAGDA